jgi:ABC-type sugar transport system, permease component
MVERKSVRYWLFALALLLTVFYLFPLVLVGINSLKTTGEFTTNPFTLPSRLVTENYPQAFSQMHFLTSLCNTLILTVTICVLVALLGSMAAYVVSRVKSRFVSFFYYLMIASMCAPFQAFMIPLVKLYSAKLGFSNSLLPVIYIATGLNMAFAVFLVRGFLNSIPLEIDQAAMIDGCGSVRLFFRIILPMLVPIEVTLLVFVAMGVWNDYLLSSLFLQTQNMRTLPMMIRVFCAQYSTDYSPMMAGLVMSIAPMLFFYLLCQKQILSGVVQGSVKG